MLCRECHAAADSEATRIMILRKLYRINGKGDMVQGYLRLNAIYESASECMTSGILWKLPKPEGL